MERKHEICSPFIPRRNFRVKTSAEIVSEIRQSLRTQSTQRPFTPRDWDRHLFEKCSVRADRDSRPPSTFSLSAQNFDAPDSRPGSGTRLYPLDHKPKLPLPSDAKIFPKPPTDPPDGKSQVTGGRARLLRAGSLTKLPPLEANAHVRDNPDAGPKLLSAKGLPGTNHADIRSTPYKHGITASESKIKQPDVDSGARSTDCRSGGRTESLVWNNTIAPFLQQIESLAADRSESSLDRLCDLCDGLHSALADADMLSRRCKKRSGILRTMFCLIDLNSTRLTLHIAKLCFALGVSGKNLLNICKLVFKISRSESNDHLFQSKSFLDSVLGILSDEDVSTSGEALVYCVGTLKFLSGNPAILRLLLDKNCFTVAQKLIQKLCRAEEHNLSIVGHIFVQLTATLRNLAEHPDSGPLFISFSILSELCSVLHLHRNDQDICTNISRVFSKLSSYSDCRLALARTPGCYRLFLELLEKHHQKQDLVVRLLFTLGNLTAKSDEARQQLLQCEGWTETLLHLYDSYQRKDNSQQKKGQQSFCKPHPPAVSSQSDDDVLVKLVRVLANMCIHSAVGPDLAAKTTCIQLLMETLELRSVQESEELMVNVAATINNLSFYQEESSVLRDRQLALAKLMLKLMLSSSLDAMLEATRVYGNLSQYKDVRDFIMQRKVHQFFVTLLDSKSSHVCFSASGVITNLALDPPNRVSLSLEGAAAKLVDCLKDLGAGDWQLAGQVCQALWNITGGGVEMLLDTQEGESLLEILMTYLDEEEALKWIENEDLRDYHKASWEIEFVPVAKKLLKMLRPLNLTA